MQERITTTRKGSITSVQAIYVPADDLTDPAQPPLLHIWMPTLSCLVVLLNWVSTLLSILWIPTLVSSIPMLLVMSITELLDQCRRFFRITNLSRTLLQFWVWMNCLKKTRIPLHVPGRSSVSCLNLSKLLKFSQDTWANLSNFPTLSQVSRRS